MVWTSPQNGIQSLAKEDLPVNNARQEEKRKTATIMEELSDGEKQKPEQAMADDRHLWEYRS